MSVLRSNLYHYSDAFILVSETVTITREGADDAGKHIHNQNE